MSNPLALTTIIHFWEQQLKGSKFLMNQTTIMFVEETIKALKRLQEMEKAKEAKNEMP